MNNYLLTLVFKADMEEKARKGLLTDITKKAVGTSGKITKQDLWGERELAYPIKKQKQGFYVHMELATEPELAKGIDKDLKVEENLLRYLLVRVQ